MVSLDVSWYLLQLTYNSTSRSGPIHTGRHYQWYHSGIKEIGPCLAAKLPLVHHAGTMTPSLDVFSTVLSLVWVQHARTFHAHPCFHPYFHPPPRGTRAIMQFFGLCRRLGKYASCTFQADCTALEPPGTKGEVGRTRCRHHDAVDHMHAIVAQRAMVPIALLEHPITTSPADCVVVVYLTCT